MGICFTILYPLLTKLSMSFMDETDLYDQTVKVIAKNFTPENYPEAASYIHYGKLLVNTVSLCAIVSVLQALSCTVAGYGFARFHFKGRGILFALVVLCMVVPTQVILTPQYLNFKAVGMLGSYAPFVALALTGVPPAAGCIFSWPDSSSGGSRGKSMKRRPLTAQDHTKPSRASCSRARCRLW